MFRASLVHHQERFVEAVHADLVCGNTRTAGHVQPLRSLSKSGEGNTLTHTHNMQHACCVV